MDHNISTCWFIRGKENQRNKIGFFKSYVSGIDLLLMPYNFFLTTDWHNMMWSLFRWFLLDSLFFFQVQLWTTCCVFISVVEWNWSEAHFGIHLISPSYRSFLLTSVCGVSLEHLLPQHFPLVTAQAGFFPIKAPELASSLERTIQC